MSRSLLSKEMVLFASVARAHGEVNQVPRLCLKYWPTDK